MQQVLATYQTPDGGYQPFTALTEADTTQLKADLGQLSENLADGSRSARPEMIGS